MKSHFLAAFAACWLASVPALAQMPRAHALQLSGGEFFSLCANPPDHGAEVAAMCQVYVAGIADALQVEGHVCFGPRMTAQKLFATSLWWLESRPREGYPASLMIRNGLIEAFPCPRPAMRTMNRPSPEQLMERFTKTMAFVTAMKTALGMLGAL
jgi:hypothetical protein